MYMSIPTISIVIATRNRCEPLSRALQSVYEQSFQDYEVLIVDDGSEAAVQEYQDNLTNRFDKRFKRVSQFPSGSPGTGPSAARNRGIEAAQGQFVAFLDDDDHWIAQDHLSVAVDCLRRANGDLFFTDMQGEIDGKIVMPRYFPNTRQLCSGEPLQPDKGVYVVSLRRVATLNYVVHPDSIVADRRLLRKIGGFWPLLRFNEDWDFMMRLIDKASLVLFRAIATVGYELPADRQANSTVISNHDQLLQKLTSTQHVRMTCSQQLVRQVARAFEAWSLRELALFMSHTGQSSEARRFAIQALATYPTLGGAWFALRTAFGRPPQLGADPRIAVSTQSAMG
jgi:glycosyltransferase involved in cell wall biosynthesis